MKKRLIFAFVMGLFLIGLVSAIPQTFSVHGKLSDDAGSVLEGTYNFTFKVYNSYSGGTALWSSINQSVITDSDGVYNVILSGIDLNFTDNYYLGIGVGDDSEMTPRINLTASPYAFRAQNVSSGGIDFETNIDLGPFNFSVNTDSLFVDSSTGNVGIGTSSPTVSLDIAGDQRLINSIAGDGRVLTFNGKPSNTAQYYGAINFYNSNVNKIAGQIIGYGRGGSWGTDMAFTTIADGETPSGPTERMRLTNDGKLGIGTTTPTTKLDVNGSINITGSGASLIFPDGTNMTTATSSLWTDSSGNATFTTGNVGIGTDSPSYKLEVNGSVLMGQLLSFSDTATLHVPDNFDFFTLKGSSNFLILDDTRMNMGANIYLGWSNDASASTSADTTLYRDSAGVIRTPGDFIIDGEIGIGTASPTGKLHVNTTGDANALVINDSTGYVGMGTASPSYDLDVYGNTRVTQNMNANLYGINTVAVIDWASSEKVYKVGSGSYWQNASFYTDSLERMRIDASGNIGIGTTTPSTKLDVNGSGLVAQFGSDPGVIAVGSIGTDEVNAFVGGYYDAGGASTVYFGQNLYFDSGWQTPDAGENTALQWMQGGSHYFNTGSTGLGTTKFLIENGGNVRVYDTLQVDDSASIGLPSGSAKLHVKTTNTADVGQIIQGVASQSADLTQWQDSTGTVLSVVDSSGNIGIGTTTPTTKLDVNGSINITGSGASLIFPDGTSQTSAASGGLWTNGTNNISYTGGNVGIGTVSPTRALEISGGDIMSEFIGSNQAYAVFRRSSYSAGVGLKVGVSSANQLGLLTTSGYGLDFGTNGAVSKMVINTDGDVGIGTASPTKKFEVNGTSGAITFDPDATTPTINTTNSQNLTITSEGGSVIIQLG